MAAVFSNKEELPEKQFRKQLAVAVRNIQWIYAIFWAFSTKQKGILGWSEGYYNGDIKTRKTTQLMDFKADQTGLHRSEQLRELFFSLSAGDSNQQTKRPSASLSPEDLTDSEWYYLVCMSFTFKPGQGLPGKVLTSNQHIWLSNAQFADSKIFSRTLLAKSASIQTIVCFPFMDGVLELGTTELVLEDPTLIQHVTTSFWKTATACSEKSVPCSPLAEDEDNLGPNINHEPVDTNASALENHSLMIECQNPLECDTPIFPLTHNSYSKKEVNLIEEQTEELHGNAFEETKVGSTDDSCNELRSNQHTDVSLRVEGLIGTSQTQSRGLMEDEFHLQGSLNSCDHIDQSFIGTKMAHPSPKGERVKNYELDYLQEGNYTKYIPMDLDADKCHFARIFHGDRSHYAGTLFAILSNSKQTYTIPYFRNSSHESSFTVWKGGSHALKFPINIPQRVLKKILLDSVSMCGSQSLKLREDNGLKNKVCKPEGEDVGASHMLSERRRREKLNEKFIILRSLVPSISKVDKASILADTIEYLKELERRVEELKSYRDQVEHEARGRRKHLDITERTSDNYGSNGITDGKRPSTSKRKACFIEDVTIDVNVSVDDNEALVEVHCPWRDCLLLHIVEAMSNLDLDAHSVQSSIVNGILALNLRAKFRSSHIASQGTIKRALQKVVGRC